MQLEALITTLITVFSRTLSHLFKPLSFTISSKVNQYLLQRKPDLKKPYPKTQNLLIYSFFVSVHDPGSKWLNQWLKKQRLTTVTREGAKRRGNPEKNKTPELSCFIVKN